MLYEEVANDIARLVESGVLRPGERIPSVRAMCEQRGVSLSTVLEAYRRLQDRGLIEPQSRSGYFVSAHWKDLPGEPEISRAPRGSRRVDVSELVFEILEATRNRKVVPLGSAFPSPLLFPLSQLARLLGTVTRRLDPWVTVSDLTPGSWELRRQIAKRYLAGGLRVDVKEIVITSGAMEALNLCLRAVTSPGDVVAVESPAFYGALQALESAGLRAFEVPADPRYGVDLDCLERGIRRHNIRACWFMTRYQNPLGCSLPDNRLRELVALLARHDIPLIEDDVYADLGFGGEPLKPAKAYDRSGLVMHCGSFAKSLAPGYRIGWAAPGRFAQKVARSKFMQSITTSIPVQETLAAYLARGGFDFHLRKLRQALQAQQNRMLEAVVDSFPAGTRVTRPRGGYFLWLEMPAAVDALEVHRRCSLQGISVAPGPMFSASRSFGNCLRLNYGHPWAPPIQRAVRTVGEIARSMVG